MRVVVSGASGFIGAHVCAQLAARGDQVIALTRPGGAAPRLAPLVGRIQRVDVDLSVPGALAPHVATADAFVHLAWYAQPHDYLTSKANLESLELTVQVIEGVLAAGCRRIVGAGTCLEYKPSDRPHTEDDPADPVSLYASSKHAAFVTARALARSAGAELAWGRIFHLQGPGESPGRLIPQVVRTLRAGQAMDVTAGAQLRDHLHVADVASAFVRMADGGLGGVVNVCSGIPVSLRQVLEAVGTIVGRRELLRFGARAYGPNETMVLTGLPLRLAGVGWRPQFPTLADSLRYLASPGEERASA